MSALVAAARERASSPQAFALMIEEQYRVNLLLDNLPVAMPLFVETEGSAESAQKVYETGCLAPPLRDRIVSGGWTRTCYYYCQREKLNVCLPAG